MHYLFLPTELRPQAILMKAICKYAAMIFCVILMILKPEIKCKDHSGSLVPERGNPSGSVPWYTTTLAPRPCWLPLRDMYGCSAWVSSLTAESPERTLDLLRVARKQELGDAVKAALLASEIFLKEEVINTFRSYNIMQYNTIQNSTVQYNTI